MFFTDRHLTGGREGMMKECQKQRPPRLRETFIHQDIQGYTVLLYYIGNTLIHLFIFFSPPAATVFKDFDDNSRSDDIGQECFICLPSFICK